MRLTLTRPENQYQQQQKQQHHHQQKDSFRILLMFALHPYNFCLLPKGLKMRVSKLIHVFYNEK